MPSPSPVRCVVVGMGGVTREMLKTLTATDWFVPAAVVDPRPEARAAARDQLALPESACFADLDTALSTVPADAAIVNTPSELHHGLTRAALAAGLHALVAKPITNDFGQAVELVELAAARGLTLAVGQQMRYRNHYRVVADFVCEGRLGTPQWANFLNTKPRPKALNLATMTQPALYEMACHHFDCLMAIFPAVRPERIVCDGFRPSWSPYAGPCMVNAAIRFGGNLHLLYQGGFSSLADNYELRIEGTGGVLRCRGVHMSRDGMAYEFAEPLGPWEPLDLEAGLPPSDPWAVLLGQWRRQMLGEVDPPFSGRNNLRPFALLCAGVDSVESGLPVALDEASPYALAFAGGAS